MKTDKRMVLNYIMLLVLFISMVKPLTGIFVHEILGVGFVLLTVVHYLNNKGWTKNIFKTMRQKDGAPKKLGTLVINSLLFASVLAVTMSGIMVSIVIFGFLNIPYFEIFYGIHTISARLVLLFSLVHLFMHMKMIVAFFRKRKQERKGKAV